MAILWITEAIPVAVTYLVTSIFYSLIGILSVEEIGSSYINSMIFPIRGGFLIAIAMEEWQLYKRVALRFISILGGTPVSII